jgi:hypothetical protein
MRSRDDKKIPPYFKCPITNELMTDPVIAADNQTYKRESISEWLARGNRISPVNGSFLSHSCLIDNLFAKKVLTEILSRQTETTELNINIDSSSHLEKCIIEKEALLKANVDRLNEFYKNKSNPLPEFILDENQEHPSLKNLNKGLEEFYTSLLEQSAEQTKLILKLKRESEKKEIICNQINHMNMLKKKSEELETDLADKIKQTKKLSKVSRKKQNYLNKLSTNLLEKIDKKK